MILSRGFHYAILSYVILSYIILAMKNRPRLAINGVDTHEGLPFPDAAVPLNPLDTTGLNSW